MKYIISGKDITNEFTVFWSNITEPKFLYGDIKSFEIK
jgi:hypothetical protein